MWRGWRGCLWVCVVRGVCGKEREGEGRGGERVWVCGCVWGGGEGRKGCVVRVCGCVYVVCVWFVLCVWWCGVCLVVWRVSGGVWFLCPLILPYSGRVHHMLKVRWTFRVERALIFSLHEFNSQKCFCEN